MAIQVSYTDQFGSTHSSAYLRVCGIRLTLGSTVASPSLHGIGDITDVVNRASITVELFHDASARNKASAANRKETLGIWDYSLTEAHTATYFADSVLDDVDKSPLSQAYTYLKTQTNPDGFGHRVTLNLTTGTTDV